ncbi:flagellar biosynthesis protein FlgA [Paenibacillus lutimineralis]|uniref:Flagellar biosynthesis protein FlgA n=1 Tax=Paenibacillus lutimineralis TaxID=2707005 RepID=A0A3Q9I709_9BACL|nr:flagellar biosynthesis protein FlgA [Paenibacillus lutimineralis]AZS14029.1 flagellar biosynthesis protein FlgA [Paenibacillus lutimineralis]
MDLKTVKSVSPNRKLFKKILALLLSILIIIVSYVVLNNANEAAKDTVEVLRISQSGGVPAYVPITEKQIKKYSIIRREYSDDMVLAKDMDSVVDKFTKYYLRDDSILYKDQFMDEKPQQNEWLYEMEDQHEVLTLPYNFLEAGGDILMPGDRVRIRVSYEQEEGSSAGNPNAGYSSGGSKMKTEILFDSIEVRDMLNSSSHSIYEVYKEVLKLSEDKRQEVMKSNDFLKSIQPKSLLLEGTKEQIDNFAKYNGYDGKKYLITMLSRKNSQVILDQLPTLQREVESWIKPKD